MGKKRQLRESYFVAVTGKGPTAEGPAGFDYNDVACLRHGVTSAEAQRAFEEHRSMYEGNDFTPRMNLRQRLASHDL